jgi:hypothetical protein
MGLGYTLFVKPLVVLGAVLAVLSGVYLLPEYWPDHASASDAIRRNDTVALGRYLARGLSPGERAQWRSYCRKVMGRTTRVGVGNSMPDLGAAQESLLSYALSRCDARESARLLVEAGADVTARDRGGWTLLGRAASCDDASLTSAMLARGADPNADEPDGGTVLWEPTNLGWTQRPIEAAIVAAMQAKGATRPTRPPARR